MRAGRSVVLRVGFGGVLIPAEVASLVAPALEVAVSDIRSGGPRGHTAHRAVERYYLVADDGGLLAPAPLADRVAGALRSRGLDVSVRDVRRYCGRRAPDLGVVCGAPPPRAAALLAAAARPRGLLVAASEAGVAAWAADLCKLYAADRTYVAASNLEQASAIQQRLTERLGGTVLLHDDPDVFAIQRGRRAVGPVRRLLALNPDDWDMVVAADAVAAVAPSIRPAWGQLPGLRAYGILRRGCAPTPRQSLLLEAAFGPALFGNREPDVAVYVAVPPWSPAPEVGADPLARKRAGVWRRVRRNRFVAAIATGARSADADALATVGLGALADDLVRRPGARRVAVLVESPDHGRHLLGHLPGWRLVRHEPRPWRGGWGGWDPGAPLRDPAGFDGTILTTLAARAAESLDVDILVRADGAGSPLPVPAFPVADRDPGRPQVLVDLADDFDPAAAEDTRTRVASYRAAGWPVAAAPAWATEC